MLINVISVDAQVGQVPGGTFTMGSSTGRPDEVPLRTIAVGGFSLFTHEVTEAQYEACVNSGGCTPAHYDDSTCRVWNGNLFMRVRVPTEARNPNFPVVCVTWQQARQYCRYKNMTLPTEIEWEYAARSGGAGSDKCSIGRKNGPNTVASCSPNSYGMYDMVGNAWEWVSDWYDADAYSYSATEFPSGPEAGIYRVIRGGGWYSRSGDASVGVRQRFSPDYSEVSIGFRCAGK